MIGSSSALEKGWKSQHPSFSSGPVKDKVDKIETVHPEESSRNSHKQRAVRGRPQQSQHRKYTFRHRYQSSSYHRNRREKKSGNDRGASSVPAYQFRELTKKVVYEELSETDCDWSTSGQICTGVSNNVTEDESSDKVNEIPYVPKVIIRRTSSYDGDEKNMSSKSKHKSESLNCRHGRSSKRCDKLKRNSGSTITHESMRSENTVTSGAKQSDSATAVKPVESNLDKLRAGFIRQRREKQAEIARNLMTKRSLSFEDQITEVESLRFKITKSKREIKSLKKVPSATLGPQQQSKTPQADNFINLSKQDKYRSSGPQSCKDEGVVSSSKSVQHGKSGVNEYQKVYKPRNSYATDRNQGSEQTSSSVVAAVKSENKSADEPSAKKSTEKEIEETTTSSQNTTISSSSSFHYEPRSSPKLHRSSMHRHKIEYKSEISDELDSEFIHRCYNRYYRLQESHWRSSSSQTALRLLKRKYRSIRLLFKKDPLVTIKREKVKSEMIDEEFEEVSSWETETDPQVCTDVIAEVANDDEQRDSLVDPRVMSLSKTLHCGQNGKIGVEKTFKNKGIIPPKKENKKLQQKSKFSFKTKPNWSKLKEKLKEVNAKKIANKKDGIVVSKDLSKLQLFKTQDTDSARRRSDDDTMPVLQRESFITDTHCCEREETMQEERSSLNSSSSSFKDDDEYNETIDNNGAKNSLGDLESEKDSDTIGYLDENDYCIEICRDSSGNDENSCDDSLDLPSIEDPDDRKVDIPELGEPAHLYDELVHENNDACQQKEIAAEACNNSENVLSSVLSDSNENECHLTVTSNIIPNLHIREHDRQFEGEVDQIATHLENSTSSEIIHEMSGNDIKSVEETAQNVANTNLDAVTNTADEECFTSKVLIYENCDDVDNTDLGKGPAFVIENIRTLHSTEPFTEDDKVDSVSSVRSCDNSSVNSINSKYESIEKTPESYPQDNISVPNISSSYKSPCDSDATLLYSDVSDGEIMSRSGSEIREIEHTNSNAETTVTSIDKTNEDAQKEDFDDNTELTLEAERIGVITVEKQTHHENNSCESSNAGLCDNAMPQVDNSLGVKCGDVNVLDGNVIEIPEKPTPLYSDISLSEDTSVSDDISDYEEKPVLVIGASIKTDPVKIEEKSAIPKAVSTVVSKSELDTKLLKLIKQRQKKAKDRSRDPPKDTCKELRKMKKSTERHSTSSEDPDDLPKINPPKRRNRTNATVSTPEKEFTDERLMHDFPKHNWLFNKYSSIKSNKVLGIVGSSSSGNSDNSKNGSNNGMKCMTDTGSRILKTIEHVDSSMNSSHTRTSMTNSKIATETVDKQQVQEQSRSISNAVNQENQRHSNVDRIDHGMVPSDGVIHDLTVPGIYGRSRSYEGHEQHSNSDNNSMNMSSYKRSSSDLSAHHYIIKNTDENLESTEQCSSNVRSSSMEAAEEMVTGIQGETTLSLDAGASHEESGEVVAVGAGKPSQDSEMCVDKQSQMPNISGRGDMRSAPRDALTNRCAASSYGGSSSSYGGTTNPSPMMPSICREFGTQPEHSQQSWATTSHPVLQSEILYPTSCCPSTSSLEIQPIYTMSDTITPNTPSTQAKTMADNRASSVITAPSRSSSTGMTSTSRTPFLLTTECSSSNKYLLSKSQTGKHLGEPEQRQADPVFQPASVLATSADGDSDQVLILQPSPLAIQYGLNFPQIRRPYIQPTFKFSHQRRASCDSKIGDTNAQTVQTNVSKSDKKDTTVEDESVDDNTKFADAPESGAVEGLNVFYMTKAPKSKRVLSKVCNENFNLIEIDKNAILGIDNSTYNAESSAIQKCQEYVRNFLSDTVDSQVLDEPSVEDTADQSRPDSQPVENSRDPVLGRDPAKCGTSDQSDLSVRVMEQSDSSLMEIDQLESSQYGLDEPVNLMLSSTPIRDLEQARSATGSGLGLLSENLGSVNLGSENLGSENLGSALSVDVSSDLDSIPTDKTSPLDLCTTKSENGSVSFRQRPNPPVQLVHPQVQKRPSADSIPEPVEDTNLEEEKGDTDLERETREALVNIQAMLSESSTDSNKSPALQTTADTNTETADIDLASSNIVIGVPTDPEISLEAHRSMNIASVANIATIEAAEIMKNAADDKTQTKNRKYAKAKTAEVPPVPVVGGAGMMGRGYCTPGMVIPIQPIQQLQPNSNNYRPQKIPQKIVPALYQSHNIIGQVNPLQVRSQTLIQVGNQACIPIYTQAISTHVTQPITQIAPRPVLPAPNQAQSSLPSGTYSLNQAGNIQPPPLLFQPHPPLIQVQPQTISPNQIYKICTNTVPMTQVPPYNQSNQISLNPAATTTIVLTSSAGQKLDQGITGRQNADSSQLPNKRTDSVIAKHANPGNQAGTTAVFPSTNIVSDSSSTRKSQDASEVSQKTGSMPPKLPQAQINFSMKSDTPVSSAASDITNKEKNDKGNKDDPTEQKDEAVDQACAETSSSDDDDIKRQMEELDEEIKRKEREQEQMKQRKLALLEKMKQSKLEKSKSAVECKEKQSDCKQTESDIDVAEASKIGEKRDNVTRELAGERMDDTSSDIEDNPLMIVEDVEPDEVDNNTAVSDDNEAVDLSRTPQTVDEPMYLNKKKMACKDSETDKAPGTGTDILSVNNATLKTGSLGDRRGVSGNISVSTIAPGIEGSVGLKGNVEFIDDIASINPFTGEQETDTALPMGDNTLDLSVKSASDTKSQMKSSSEKVLCQVNEISIEKNTTEKVKKTMSAEVSYTDTTTGSSNLNVTVESKDSEAMETGSDIHTTCSDTASTADSFFDSSSDLDSAVVDLSSTANAYSKDESVCTSIDLTKVVDSNKQKVSGTVDATSNIVKIVSSNPDDLIKTQTAKSKETPPKVIVSCQVSVASAGIPTKTTTSFGEQSLQTCALSEHNSKTDEVVDLTAAASKPGVSVATAGETHKDKPSTVISFVTASPTESFQAGRNKYTRHNTSWKMEKWKTDTNQNVPSLGKEADVVTTVSEVSKSPITSATINCSVAETLSSRSTANLQVSSSQTSPMPSISYVSTASSGSSIDLTNQQYLASKCSQSIPVQMNSKNVFHSETPEVIFVGNTLEPQKGMFSPRRGSSSQRDSYKQMPPRKHKTRFTEVIIQPAHCNNIVSPRKRGKKELPSPAHQQMINMRPTLKVMHKTMVMVPSHLKQSCPYYKRPIAIELSPKEVAMHVSKTGGKKPPIAHMQLPFGVPDPLINPSIGLLGKRKATEELVTFPPLQCYSVPSTPTEEPEQQRSLSTSDLQEEFPTVASPQDNDLPVPLRAHTNAFNHLKNRDIFFTNTLKPPETKENRLKRSNLNSAVIDLTVETPLRVNADQIQYMKQNKNPLTETEKAIQEELAVAVLKRQRLENAAQQNTMGPNEIASQQSAGTKRQSNLQGQVRPKEQQPVQGKTKAKGPRSEDQPRLLPYDRQRRRHKLIAGRQDVLRQGEMMRDPRMMEAGHPGGVPGHHGQFMQLDNTGQPLQHQSMMPAEMQQGHFMHNTSPHMQQQQQQQQYYHGNAPGRLPPGHHNGEKLQQVHHHDNIAPHQQHAFHNSSMRQSNQSFVQQRMQSPYQQTLRQVSPHTYQQRHEATPQHPQSAPRFHNHPSTGLMQSRSSPGDISPHMARYPGDTSPRMVLPAHAPEASGVIRQVGYAAHVDQNAANVQMAAGSQKVPRGMQQPIQSPPNLYRPPMPAHYQAPFREDQFVPMSAGMTSGRPRQIRPRQSDQMSPNVMVASTNDGPGRALYQQQQQQHQQHQQSPDLHQLQRQQPQLPMQPISPSATRGEMLVNQPMDPEGMHKIKQVRAQFIQTQQSKNEARQLQQQQQHLQHHQQQHRQEHMPQHQHQQQPHLQGDFLQNGSSRDRTTPQFAVPMYKCPTTNQQPYTGTASLPAPGQLAAPMSSHQITPASGLQTTMASNLVTTPSVAHQQVVTSNLRGMQATNGQPLPTQAHNQQTAPATNLQVAPQSGIQPGYHTTLQTGLQATPISYQALVAAAGYQAPMPSGLQGTQVTGFRAAPSVSMQSVQQTGNQPGQPFVSQQPSLSGSSSVVTQAVYVPISAVPSQTGAKMVQVGQPVCPPQPGGPAVDLKGQQASQSTFPQQQYQHPYQPTPPYGNSYAQTAPNHRQNPAQNMMIVQKQTVVHDNGGHGSNTAQSHFDARAVTGQVGQPSQPEAYNQLPVNNPVPLQQLPVTSAHQQAQVVQGDMNRANPAAYQQASQQQQQQQHQQQQKQLQQQQGSAADVSQQVRSQPVGAMATEAEVESLDDANLPHLQQIHGTCILCGKFSLYLCSSCKQIWYCSPECQLKHWQQHSAECKGNVT